MKEKEKKEKKKATWTSQYATVHRQKYVKIRVILFKYEKLLFKIYYQIAP